MKALWIESGKPRVRELPSPFPSPGEVLIEIRAVGICNTDLELNRGYMNFTGVPGHEFVGVVRSADSALAGKRVTGEINIGCSKCRYCLMDMPRHCLDREVLGIFKRQGAFAEYIALPEKNLHPIADEVDDRTAVFVEPLAAALRIPEQVKIAPGSRILLIGDGKLAQLIARVLALYGAGLTVVGKHARKLALMAPFATNVFHKDEFKSEERFETVIEASGGPEGLETARRALLPMGLLILKSTYARQVQMDLAPYVVDELRILGSRCGPFAPAVDLLAQRLVDPSPLIDGVFSLDEVEKAFEAAGKPGALKVVVHMERS